VFQSGHLAEEIVEMPKIFLEHSVLFVRKFRLKAGQKCVILNLKENR
jgi:hypothetical protein